MVAHNQEILHYRAGTRPAPTVAEIVRAFKSGGTYRAGRELNIRSIWQRNYYEQILRDRSDHERIAKYITSNPMNWDQDEENVLQGRRMRRPCGEISIK